MVKAKKNSATATNIEPNPGSTCSIAAWVKPVPAEMLAKPVKIC